MLTKRMKLCLITGALLGLMVSFAFYSAVGFTDVVSFLAGILYGMIIEYVAFKLDGADRNHREDAAL